MGFKRWWDENFAKAPSERAGHDDEVTHNAQRKTPAEDAPVANAGPDQADAGASPEAAAGGARQ